MDLAWCIICDQRIPDELTMADDSLYCSQQCRQRDECPTKPVLNPSTDTLKQPIVLKSYMTKKSTAKHHLYRTTTAYPWVPLYRKRRGSAQRRCSQSHILYPQNTNLIH